MTLLYATHPAAVQRWVSLHPELETDIGYVIHHEQVVEILVKNSDASQESSGTGALVHVDQLPQALFDKLKNHGKQSFAHAVRRYMSNKLNPSTKSYFRIDVGLIGGSSYEVNKCLILIHTDHPPR